jgi:hypothetical protein
LSNRFPTLVVLIAGATIGLPASARADERGELEALRAEIRAERDALRAEREELARQRERVDAALASIEARDVGSAPPGVSEGPPPRGSQARLDVYGFAHADLIYDVDRVDPDWKATLRPSKIPIRCPGEPGCGNDGETIVSARQSRLGVKGLLPTAVGDIETIFEFDLFGVGDDAGETTFRLRHAWGELGPLGAGQTWSLFMDPDVFPNTVDYWGPAGMVFLRNPQVRWTAWDRDGLRVAMALESPGSALDEGKAAQQIDGTFASWNQYPDFSTQLRLDRDWGHVQFAALFRGLGFEAPASPGGSPDGQVFGAAGNLSGSIDLFENDKILWQLVGGRGFASYMNDGGTDLAPNSALSAAEAVSGIGWLLYYNRQWSERFTSSIGFSEHRQFTTGGQLDNAFETGQYGNVNLLYHPTAGMYVGPEFLWGRRENRDGGDGTDSRVQVSFHYDFAGAILGRSE